MKPVPTPTPTPNRKVLHIPAATRSDVALRQLLRMELDIMEFNEACFVRNQNTACLHDYRVALRRSRVLLLRIHGVFTVRDLKRFGRRLAGLGQLTGACRDLDVLIQHWSDSVMASETSSQQIFRFLQQQLQNARVRLVEEFGKQKYSAFKQNWRNFLAAKPGIVRMQQAALPISVLLHAQLERVQRKLGIKLTAIHAESSDKALHRLRIACKRLRYLLDVAHQIDANTSNQKFVSQLKKLQEGLGAYQDLIVQREVVVSLSKTMAAAGLSSEEIIASVDSIEHAVNNKIRQQREHVLELIGKMLRTGGFVQAV